MRDINFIIRFKYSFLVILFIMIAGQNSIICQPVNITDQLILHHPFDGNSNDESRNGNDAVVHGAILGEDRNGNPAGAYYFDGLDDYIELNDDFDYPNRSVCLWFRAIKVPVWIPGYKDLSLDILYTSDHPDLKYGLTKLWISKMDDVDMVFFHNGGATNIDDFAYEIIPNQWNFVVITVTPDMIHYYLNGLPVGKRVFPGNIHSYEVTPLKNAALGIGRKLNHRFYNGAIDDVYIYNRAINACEVLYLYNGSLQEER